MRRFGGSATRPSARHGPHFDLARPVKCRGARLCKIRQPDGPNIAYAPGRRAIPRNRLNALTILGVPRTVRGFFPSLGVPTWRLCPHRAYRQERWPIMDQQTDHAIEWGEDGFARGIGRQSVPHGPFRRGLRALIHFFSYHLVLSRRTTRATRAAGFSLTVHPTVFHPRYFISSECFAEFIDGLD